MNKELTPLEALERYGYHCNHYVNGKKDYEIIETALKDYEDLIGILKEFGIHNNCDLIDNLRNIKLLEKVNAMNKKELKALEIIKEKNVDVEWLMRSETLIQYNGCIGNRHKEIEQEEFDLLKEVFLYEQK